ncbi:MAG: hypothetical protein H6834_15495 [Planctomycetes bacterium]|nr:hypothetical protein [Planctomycetota bacterium]
MSAPPSVRGSLTDVGKEWSDGLLKMLGMKKPECPGCHSGAVIRTREMRKNMVVWSSLGLILSILLLIVGFVVIAHDALEAGLSMSVVSIGLGSVAGWYLYVGTTFELRTCRDCGFTHRGDGYSQWKVWGG